MNQVHAIAVKRLGLREYLPTQAAMREFTLGRTAEAPDEIWLLEHPPIYTLGLRAAERTAVNGIPVVRADRGGDITYHGPGQLVVYALIDLGRRGLGVRQWVRLLEQAVIDLLEGGGERRDGAPGVYVGGAKVAALGLRVRNGRAYHGLSLNVDMDLAPFSAIDPCGYPGLAVTQLRDLGRRETVQSAGERLARILVRMLEDA